MAETHIITFTDKVRHLLNPLHIYCRLTNLGVASGTARDICKIYEESIYKPTLGRKGMKSTDLNSLLCE